MKNGKKEEEKEKKERRGGGLDYRGRWLELEAPSVASS